jgi:uncharacterized membrane protein (DUF106 family)
MSFWELLALVGTMAIILGVFLTFYALINNKTLKEESKLTRETIASLIKEEAKNTRDMLDRMEERQIEARKETRELFERIEKEQIESRKYIADLIVSEGEKTRQAVKSLQ